MAVDIPLEVGRLRNILLAVGLALMPFASAGVTPAAAQQQGEQRQGVQQLVPPNAPQGSFADLAERLLDSVVNISTSQRVSSGGSRGIPMPQVPEGSPFQEFFDEFFNRERNGEDTPRRRSRRVQSLGSGFVIDPSGIIITNNHVIEGADEIVANFADGSRLDATIVGRDPKTDIAVLKVESPTPLAAVKFGDSENMRVGEWVMAIGNPFGFGGTVTVGIVSALNRDINSGPYDNFIQTDASINRGNSGGPLFNLDGEVIGINTAIISPTGGSIGIGFAIPSDISLRVIAQLREFGETRRGWLGVRIQEVTDEIAESLDMDSAQGALVAGVNEDGPAAEAGIEPGDVILEFDGQTVPSMRDLPRMVADTEVSATVDIVVLRKGERKTLSVTLGRLEESEEAADIVEEEPPVEETEPSDVQIMGLSLAPLTDQARQDYSIAEDVKGVVVTEVEPGSIAEDKRIQAGDVIVEVSQEAVSRPKQVVDRIETLRKNGRRSALLLLSSANGELRFVALRMDED